MWTVVISGPGVMETGKRALPVRRWASPGQVITRPRGWSRYDRLLHRCHVSRVRFEQRGVFTRQQRALVTPELGPSVLKPHLWTWQRLHFEQQKEKINALTNTHTHVHTHKYIHTQRVKNIDHVTNFLTKYSSNLCYWHRILTSCW